MAHPPLVFLGLAIAISAAPAAVVVVQPSDFNADAFESFDGQPAGPVHQFVFDALGIISVDFSVSGGLSDIYNDLPGTSAALGANDTQLLIVLPGQNIGPLASYYQFVFAWELTGFGFTIADQGLSSQVTIGFGSGGMPIEQFSFLPGSASPESIFLRTDFAFDEVTISQDTGSGLGFVVDDLAVEAVIIPEPARPALIGLASVILLLRRWRILDSLITR